jgi:hypothetical protein
MADGPKIAPLRGIARPSRRLTGQIGRLYGPKAVERFDQIMDDVVAVDALARLLTEAIERNTTKDGRIDMKDVASHVLGEMKRHPK